MVYRYLQNYYGNPTFVLVIYSKLTRISRCYFSYKFSLVSTGVGICQITIKTSESTDFLLVIDEIQKIDNWSEIVKQQWDRDTRESINIKVILLGSSRLLIQKGLTESLAGRFETMYFDTLP